MREMEAVNVLTVAQRIFVEFPDIAFRNLPICQNCSEKPRSG